MNIGINARFLFSDVLEGLGRYTWETTKRMILDHNEDHFFLFFDRPFPDKYIIADNVTPIILSPPARHPFLFYLWFEWILPKALNKYNIDVFYSADNFMSLKAKVPTLLVIHDLAYLHYPHHIRFSHLKYYQYFIPKYVQKANHIITVSEFVKRDIIKQFSVNEDNVSVAFNALPDRKLNLSDSPMDRSYFIYVGSINPRKNIRKLIEAFLNLPFSADNLALVLVGKYYNLSSETISIIEKGINNNRIIHLEGLADDYLMNWINHATALVYPSLFEGFGIPLLEAMSLGTPVITSNVTSMPEVADNAAILVNPDNTSEISQAMNTLLTKPELALQLSIAGKQRVNDFSWDNTSSIIYKKLVDISN